MKYEPSYHSFNIVKGITIWTCVIVKKKDTMLFDEKDIYEDIINRTLCGSPCCLPGREDMSDSYNISLDLHILLSPPTQVHSSCQFVLCFDFLFCSMQGSKDPN